MLLWALFFSFFMLKRGVKNLFLYLHLDWVFDACLFRYSQVSNYISNSRFKRNHPSFSLPPDYFLHETFQLNYDLYKQDGEQSAQEIIGWAKQHKQDIGNILDWGCGVARITRHLPAQFSSVVNVTGIDINNHMIEWSKDHIPDIEFMKIQYLPPTSLPNSRYDLIIGISVLTHIEGAYHNNWLDEIFRILQDDGLFIFTTHGKYFNSKLTAQERGRLLDCGCFTKSYRQAGHRMMSTYTVADVFRGKLLPYFDILEFHSGHLDLSKTGGQDLWIVRKKARARKKMTG